MKYSPLLFTFLTVTALGGCASLPNPGGGLPATFADAASTTSSDVARQSLGPAVGDYLQLRLGREISNETVVLHNAAAARAIWSNGKGYGAAWQNSRTKVMGSIKPTSRVEPKGDALCRHFHDTIQRPGDTEFGIDGIACLTGQVWTVDY